MYWVIWPNKNIWEIQTPATTYIRITEKRQAMNYVIGGRKISYSIYIWVTIFLYNHTSWTDSCQNLASYWETKLNSYYYWHWVTGDFKFESIVSLKMIYSKSLLSWHFERHRLNVGIIYAKPGKIYTWLHLITCLLASGYFGYLTYACD